MTPVAWILVVALSTGGTTTVISQNEYVTKQECAWAKATVEQQADSKIIAQCAPKFPPSSLTNGFGKYP